MVGMREKGIYSSPFVLATIVEGADGRDEMQEPAASEHGLKRRWIDMKATREGQKPEPSHGAHG